MYDFGYLQLIWNSYLKNTLVFLKIIFNVIGFGTKTQTTYLEISTLQVLTFQNQNSQSRCVDIENSIHFLFLHKKLFCKGEHIFKNVIP